MIKRKVVIIGDGFVGSTTAYTLALSNYISEISIVDIKVSRTMEYRDFKDKSRPWRADYKFFTVL